MQNNPVNYTDPSGHFWKSIQKAWNGAKKMASNAWNATKSAFSHAANWVSNKVNQAIGWVGTQVTNVTNVTNVTQWVGNQIVSAYNFVKGAISQGYHSVTNLWQQAKIMGQSTYDWGKSNLREAESIYRNWSEALEGTIRHVCQLATKATGGIAVHASTISFDSGQTTVAYEFKQNLIKQYGFDDETADIMWKLHQNIQKAEGKNADYVFNRVLGGAQYDGFKWDNTAGSIGEIKTVLGKYGLTGSQADKLVYNIRIQYLLSSGSYGSVSDLSLSDYKAFKATASKIYPNMDFDTLWNSNYSKYSNKIDFAHQSITTATHLYGKPRLADVYGIFVGGTNGLAGWRGDVTKDAEATPSLGNDDYRADLDAVNITALMQDRKIDYVTASNQYYDGIALGVYTRADQFKKNINLNYVKQSIYSSLVPRKTRDIGPNIQTNIPRTDGESMDYLRMHYPASYNFIRSLEDGTNDLKDYVRRP